MDFLGLVLKYRVNRSLTQQEVKCHLRQGERLEVQPHYQLCVVKMNATFLESVDKWFGWKGLLSAMACLIIAFFSISFLVMLYTTITISPDLRSREDGLIILIVVAAMFIPFIGWAIWILKKDSFAYTHYPIRFNRITKMVYVFRTNGSILEVPWGQIYFTLGHLRLWNEWEIQGHILEEDNVTIRETFPLSYVGTLSASDVKWGHRRCSSDDFLRAHWEFIRRFMEEGPQEVSEQVQFCMPISTSRERFNVGAERIFANFAGAPFPIYWMMFPFCFVVSLFRSLAMRTSKIPQWPKEVEAECIIYPDDPYAIEGTLDGERVSIFPSAASAAGVRFSPPSKRI